MDLQENRKKTSFFDNCLDQIKEENKVSVFSID